MFADAPHPGMCFTVPEVADCTPYLSLCIQNVLGVSSTVRVTSPKWQTWRVTYCVQCTRSYVSMEQYFSTGNTRTISGARSCLVICQFRRVPNLRKATVSFVMSVCPRGTTWLLHGLLFMKFDILVFFEKTVEKIQASLKSDMNNGYFRWRPKHNQIKHQVDATLCSFYLCRVTQHVSGVKRPSSGVFKNWHGGPWYRCYSCR